ncbi:MAG: PASTA domain-containing protein [Fuerstiella sp.]|nr:PASTA domain-containing protein [Fuerstiella sp.]
MRRLLVVAVLFTGLSAAVARAQPSVRRGASSRTAAQPAQDDSTLWRVLEDWSAKSAKIKRLEGDVMRRSYDLAFSTEKLGVGKFLFESPDKGFLKIEPLKITPKLLADRKARGAPRNKTTGGLFELLPDTSEEWICDGLRVISKEHDTKLATVLNLRPEERGRNIMNGPLPFLFGLPPADALARFRLKLVRQQDQYTFLMAEPKNADDSRNWSKADIKIDMQTGLPTHVRLTNPAGTSQVTYAFSDLVANSRLSKFWEKLGNSKFNARIPSGWTVKVVNRDGSAEKNATATDDSGPRSGMPNLVGMSDRQASAALNRIGIAKTQIRKLKGPVAETKADEHRVRRQVPKPGSLYDKTTQVALEYWTVQ